MDDYPDSLSEDQDEDTGFEEKEDTASQSPVKKRLHRKSKKGTHIFIQKTFLLTLL